MSQNIIKKYGIQAKKQLGQNFLIDHEKLDIIATAVGILGENIIEVGPGYGALTEKILAKKPKSLNLVELDNDMVDILYDRFGTDAFTLHKKDILTYTPDSTDYSVIANIPYYITSPILRHFLYEVPQSPQNMVILMQKDVAEKILGGKKDKTSVLRLFIEKKCSVEHVVEVPSTCFSPAPKVDSTVLLFKNNDIYRDTDDTKFLECIKLGFAEPRKTLIKNLNQSGYEKENIVQYLNELGIDCRIRGEDLSISQWIRLSHKLFA